MSENPLNLPSACSEALQAIEADPRDLSAEIQSHLRGCPACAEARVLWLAMEEDPLALAPVGYFDRLPGRILGKLPSGRPAARRTGWIAAAAALMLLTAGGSFLAGRINREPLVEASNPKPASDLKEAAPELPFHDKYEVIEQFQNLSPEEAQVLLKQLEKQDPGSNP